MAKNFITTPEDETLRSEVVRTILIGLAEDAEFGNPKTFARWQRENRDLLIGLFGGKGTCNLARVVAFLRREALNMRHARAEIMCGLLQGLDDGELPDAIRLGLESLNILTRTDLIAAAMLDIELSRSLLKECPEGGLEQIAGAMF